MMNSTPLEEKLNQAICGYRRWLQLGGYTTADLNKYDRVLKPFVRFVLERKLSWDEIFTVRTLSLFQTVTGRPYEVPIRGLASYLFDQEMIQYPLGKLDRRIPEIFASYVKYYRQTQKPGRTQFKILYRLLTVLHQHLDAAAIEVDDLNIEHLDTFLAGFNAPLATGSRRLYRTYLRGFLSWLYRQGIIKRNLAPLLVGPRIYGNAKPPKYLRPIEIRRLFDAADTDTPTGLRTYAMLHLAFGLGLRPGEVSRIELDDIHFADGELAIKERKNGQPVMLPLSDDTLKAIVAYVVGGRPACKHRALFLNHSKPHAPILSNTVSRYIGELMRKAGLQASAYWLRHTYAQNLLESGVSVFEIKEMMGHDRIESSRRYLHVHVKLMREVILNETV